jgi:copper(I)-binding protein
MLTRCLALVALLSAGAAQAEVKIDTPWLRPTVQGQLAGGGFVGLRSALPDRLLGVSTPAAGRVEMHTMTMDGDVMRMRQLEAIDLPAGQLIELKPGGLHLMLMDLKAPLKNGDSVPLTLTFEKAGQQTVQARISSTAPLKP